MRMDLNSRIQKGMEAADRFEKNNGNCAQCTLGALRMALDDGVITDDIFRAASGLAAGVSRSGTACGAVTGGVMAISAYVGRTWEDFSNAGGSARSLDLGRRLVDRFKKEYGSQNCWQIQEKIMGRHYDFTAPGEYEMFLEAGGHDDKCPAVCANAVKWVLEIMDAEGLV